MQLLRRSTVYATASPTTGVVVSSHDLLKVMHDPDALLRFLEHDDHQENLYIFTPLKRSYGRTNVYRRRCSPLRT